MIYKEILLSDYAKGKSNNELIGLKVYNDINLQHGTVGFISDVNRDIVSIRRKKDGKLEIAQFKDIYVLADKQGNEIGQIPLPFGKGGGISHIIEKIVNGDNDRTAEQSGNYRVDMVYENDYLTLDFYYLDRNNPRFEIDKIHYATYKMDKLNKTKGVFKYHDQQRYDIKGKRISIKDIIEKTKQGILENGYNIGTSIDWVNDNADELANGGSANGGNIPLTELAKKHATINCDKVPDDFKEVFKFIKDKTNNFTKNTDKFEEQYNRAYDLLKKEVADAIKQPQKSKKVTINSKIKGLKILSKRLKGDKQDKIKRKLKGLEIIAKRLN